MTGSARACLLVGALHVLASSAPAQIGELQLGLIGSYGTGEAYGPGAGVVLGVATGRLAYVGVRWAYHTGATKAAVTNRVQVFAVDLGLDVPLHGLEVFPSVSLGAIRFAQRALGVSGHSTEFLAAPGVSVEVRAGRVALVPELQYSLAGDPNPDLSSPVRYRGLIASVKLVMLFEVGRIRR